MGDIIATIFLPRRYILSDIFRISQGGVLSFNRTVHWRIEHATSSLSWSERCQTSFLQHYIWPLNSPDLNPVDYSFWSVLQEKVHRSTIANVSELDMRLINEIGCIVQSIVSAVIGQWRRRLSACVRGAGHTLSTNIKFQLFCHVHCIYQKLR